MTPTRAFDDVLSDSSLAAEMRAGLAAVETELREAVKSDDPFVSEAARHLVVAGGKRFRPMVVLMAAQFVVIFFWFPETKGLSLEQIQMKLEPAKPSGR